MERRILVINGPNLNLLGEREPDIYGCETLETIGADCRKHGATMGFDVDWRQSNHEGEIVDWIQAARRNAAGIVINAGAYSHTSLAILDALKSFEGPVIEVHLSNIFRRESFRHHSYVSLAALGVICGFGKTGYELALTALAGQLASSP